MTHITAPSSAAGAARMAMHSRNPRSASQAALGLPVFPRMNSGTTATIPPSVNVTCNQTGIGEQL